MKQIRELQYESARTLYQKLRSVFGQKTSLSDISALEREIFSSTYRGPMSGNYRVRGYEPIDMKSLTTELGLVAADSYTLFTFLDEIGKAVGIAQFAAGVIYSYIRNSTSKPIMLLSSLLSNTFVEGVTDEIAIGEAANTSVTTTTISEQGYITLQTIDSRSKAKRLSAKDISVEKRGDGDLSIQGDVFAVFNDTTSVVSFSVRGGNTAGLTIDAVTEAAGVNLISIRYTSVSPVRVRVEVSSDGRTFTRILDEVSTRDIVEIPVTSSYVERLRVSFDFASPSRFTMGTPLWELAINAIRLTQMARLTSGVYETVPIQIPSDGTKGISLVTKDSTYGNAFIRYFLGLVTAGNTSYIETKPGTIINLGKRNVTLNNIGPDEIWPLRADARTGGRFYNILSSTAHVEDLGTTIVENGSFAGGITVIPRSLRVYRGIDNYVRMRGTDIETSVRELTVIPEIDQTRTQVKPVPLPFEHTELIDKESISGNRIVLECLPTTNSVVIRENGERPIVSTVIDKGESSGEYYVELDNAAIDAITSSPMAFTITYTTTLTSHLFARGSSATIRSGSLAVSARTPLTYGTDYFLDRGSFSIMFDVHGKYYQQCNISTGNVIRDVVPIHIQYVVTEHVVAENNYVWNTWIYVGTMTPITILPFTTAEIALGNFHRIDGVNVSAITQYTVREGWHLIETTQPFPTMIGNSADVNPLTKQPSSAGIIIPDTAKQRAFRESMRQVSLFQLSTLSPADIPKCFAFDFNTIYVAYQPESVPRDLITSPGLPPSTGKTLLCRKPVYDSTMRCIGYVSVPERFLIEVEYEKEGDTGVDSVIVRAELTASEPGDMAVIERLGINRLSEV